MVVEEALTVVLMLGQMELLEVLVEVAALQLGVPETLLQQLHHKEIVVELEMEIMEVVVAGLVQMEKQELLELEVVMVGTEHHLQSLEH